MPIRQNILRKGKAPKQNLLQFDVLQEESGILGDLTTSRFFKISEFPSVLPSGNSSFLIEGSNLLKPEIELKTELLDAQGNPIFHYAIPNYDKELPARRIAIEVYDDEVVNGVGSFTVLGELNPREFDIPNDFQDTYNVRFTAPISINRKIKNTQPIRFYGDPTISVSELVKGVIERVPTGDSTQTSITGSVEFINISPQTEFSTDSGSTTGNSNQFEEVGNSVASYINQNQGSAQSSILPQTSIPKKPYTFVVKEMEKGVDNALNKITSGMKGASFSITRPDLLVDSTTYPDSKFDKPQTFDTKILDVINSTTFTTTTEYTITNKNNNNKIIVPLNASSSNATITHNVVSSTETEDQVFKRSFANMTVGNLRTFSGDTYKAKIYMKEEGTSGEFEPIYETLVESPNELVNPNSISGFQNIGLFFTQSIIENNWVSSSNSTATTDDDTLIDGVLLSGSNGAVGDSFTFVTNNTLSLEKNEDYIVEFNVAYDKASKTQSDGTTKKEAELEVFITGSFVTENQSEVSLGKVDLPGVERTSGFTKVAQRQITDFKTHNGNSSPSGSLGFRVNAGQFILQDVRLRPFSQTNFSPGFFKANVPMPKPIKRGKFYDFMVEFYDANNNLAETVAIVDNVSFEGPPQIIQGVDNLLTGSMFLGSLTGSGIEVHGGSAYIRSIGYNGFNDTISSNVGGFLMFSGSVSESMGTTEDYEGVGLEIVDAHGDEDRFLKFKTNAEGTPSEFEIQTDTFFLGKSGQFISGSNGSIVISSSQFFLGGENTFVSGANDKLEISSSNFHLDDDGSVTMQGTITAEAGGTIGGFTVGSDDLTATNFVLNTATQKLSLGSSDNIIILSGSKGLSVGNAKHENSPFRVDLSGNVVATSATITGEVNATSGTALDSITALGFATASLTSSVVLLDASASAATQSIAVNVSSSAAATTTADVGVSGSTSATTTADVGISGSTSATTTAEVGISSSAAVTSDVADTRAQLVLDNSSANDQKINLVNTTGGIMSSFGKGVKFFGSSSNALVTSSANGTVNYSEVNDKGFLIVTGSATASFFGNTTTIGDTSAQHISIEPDSLSIKTAANKTVLSASAAGITMSGSINAGDGTIGGFVITENQIKSSDNNIVLNKDSKAIGISSTTFGNTGIQLQHNSGTPRAHIGKSDGEGFKFDGTNVVMSASSFQLGNNTSFVSGSNGNVKISGSSVDIQTPAFILGDLDSSFVSGSNGNLSMGADTFTLAATGSNDTGIMINSAQATILATGSNSITDANSVILDGGAGVIQVSQSATGIFDTGRTAVFTKNTVVDPAVFKQGSLQGKEIVSSSTEITNPVPTAENLQVISSSKMNRLETQQLYMDTNSTTSGEGSLTPFFYVDKGVGRYANAGINSASSVAFASQKNLTGLSHTNRSLPPEFIFSAEYFTIPIETPGEFGFVNNSESSGSSIFTITTKVSGSNHTSATGDTDDFTDAKFNILALEADTRGLPNARKSEFTFLQAKASSSIMFQLQHDGDVVSRGNLTAFGTSFLTVSDEREKKNIYQISESLDKVLELRPTKFTWRETDKEDVGFIAQEVEEIIPEVVETTKGFIDIDNEKQPEERKTISYPKLVPYLVDTIKELTKRIEELEKKVK